jgi:hypothetical protein
MWGFVVLPEYFAYADYNFLHQDPPKIPAFNLVRHGHKAVGSFARTNSKLLK